MSFTSCSISIPELAAAVEPVWTPAALSAAEAGTSIEGVALKTGGAPRLGATDGTFAGAEALAAGLLAIGLLDIAGGAGKARR